LPVRCSQYRLEWKWCQWQPCCFRFILLSSENRYRNEFRQADAAEI